jgi:LysM repeat protein
MFVRLAVLIVLAVAVWIGFARPSEGAGPERTYVVRPADTLWAIATANYAGDPREAVWRLRQRNGLHGTLLRPGQRLVLPS